MKTLPIGATVETLRPGRDGILRGRVVREETDHYYQSRGLKSYVIKWTTPALGAGGGWLADDVRVIRSNPAEKKVKAPPKDPPYGSPAYWAIKDAEADARKYHDWERSRSEPYGRKANPSGHGIVYMTPGNGPASRVRAGNDGRFYVEDYTGAPMSSGWAMASEHGTLAAAIERAKDSAAMRVARRNPRPSTLATRWATTPEKAPRGYVTDRVDAAGFPVFRKGEWSVDGTMMIRHEGQATGIPGQRDRHGWRASTWTAGRGWVDAGSLAATPAEAAKQSGGTRQNPARRRKKTGAKRKSFQAQSILLDKDTFTLSRARDWLKKNGKKYGKITDGDADWHAEQHPASDYQPTRKGGYGGFHTIQLGKHVQAIVGIPQRGSDAAEAAGYNTKGPGLFGNRKASGPATVADYNAEDVLY